MQIVEEIPDALRSEVEASLAWLNAEQGRHFRVTGVVDPQTAEGLGATPHDLTLILCEGDRCLRERLRVRALGDRFEIARAQGERLDPPAEIDPPPGVRSGWLESVLAQHAFIVLVFYRGFW